MVRHKKSISGFLFDSFNYAFLGIFALCTILPFIYVIAGLFASDAELTELSFFLIPETFSLAGYTFIFSTGTLFTSIGVTIYITVVGTLVNLLFTVTMAYPLARRSLWGRNTVLNMVVFSMLFSGGMIPTYLVVKGLGLLDSFWSLMLPGAISAFNMIVVKNFFQELPPALEESAKIDGAGDLTTFIRVVLPLTVPALATVSLFVAVYQWNSWFDVFLYNSSRHNLSTLQYELMKILSTSNTGASAADQYADAQGNAQMVTPTSIRATMTIVASVPIIMVYPFLQKYFVKGMVVGGVKG